MSWSRTAWESREACQDTVGGERSGGGYLWADWLSLIFPRSVLVLGLTTGSNTHNQGGQKGPGMKDSGTRQGLPLTTNETPKGEKIEGWVRDSNFPKGIHGPKLKASLKSLPRDVPPESWIWKQCFPFPSRDSLLLCTLSPFFPLFLSLPLLCRITTLSNSHWLCSEELGSNPCLTTSWPFIPSWT